MQAEATLAGLSDGAQISSAGMYIQSRQHQSKRDLSSAGMYIQSRQPPRQQQTVKDTVALERTREGSAAAVVVVAIAAVRFEFFNETDGFVAESDGFRTENDELYAKNDEFRAKNDGFLC